MKQQAIIESIQAELDAVYENDDVKPVCAPFATLGTEIVSKLPLTAGRILVLSDLGLLAAVLRRFKPEQVTFVAHTTEQEVFAQDLAVKTWQVGYNDPIKHLEKHLMGMKFDIIVGNPPYQAPNNVSTKLWPQFASAAFESLVPNGYLAFVTPTSWTQPLSGRPSNMNQRTNDIMFGNSLLYCDLDANRFFNVGVDISAYVLKKDGKASPVRYMVRRRSEVADVLLGQADSERFVNADATVWGRHATVAECTTEFCVPLRMKKGIVYSDRDDHTLRFQPKVIIPRDLGYFPQCDKLGQYGFNWQARAHLCSSAAEAESAFSVYNSKLFRWAVKNFSWVPQTDFTLLSMIKLPPFDHVWTDAELLEFYGLSEDDLS